MNKDKSCVKCSQPREYDTICIYMLQIHIKFMLNTPSVNQFHNGSQFSKNNSVHFWQHILQWINQFWFFSQLFNCRISGWWSSLCFFCISFVRQRCVSSSSNAFLYRNWILPSTVSRCNPRIWSLIKFVLFGTLSACRIPTEFWSKWPGPLFGTCELQYTWNEKRQKLLKWASTVEKASQMEIYSSECSEGYTNTNAASKSTSLYWK